MNGNAIASSDESIKQQSPNLPFRSFMSCQKDNHQMKARVNIDTFSVKTFATIHICPQLPHQPTSARGIMSPPLASFQIPEGIQRLN